MAEESTLTSAHEASVRSVLVGELIKDLEMSLLAGTDPLKVILRYMPALLSLRAYQEHRLATDMSKRQTVPTWRAASLPR
ncbi:MAG: hypothetical protein AB1446_01590 [Bacillota bacterium]